MGYMPCYYRSTKKYEVVLTQLGMQSVIDSKETLYKPDFKATPYFSNDETRKKNVGFEVISQKKILFRKKKGFWKRGLNLNMLFISGGYK
jgi:hypothetical protein